jgi:hypothetical protein
MPTVSSIALLIDVRAPRALRVLVRRSATDAKDDAVAHGADAVF